jgi:mRNA degradation ribonuclease J1/J2
VIREVDPDHLIPVHTMGREWFAERFDSVVKLVEGERIQI